MAVAGDYFEVELLPVHLNWGTTSRDGTRHRHPDEVYIPIPINIARDLNLFNDGTEFSVQGQNFNVKATGTQGCNNEYGKNLTSANGLKPLGRYLKGTLNAHPGDIVRVEWITDTHVSIELV